MIHDPATLGDLVSSKVIAQRLGVTRTAVGMWRSRETGFPAPLDVPGVSVPLFSWTQVSAWNATRRDRSR